MKACVVLALFLVVALAAVAQSNEAKAEVPQIHNLLKRQIRPIIPQLPRCALWECNSNCIRRGFRGGYCAFTGCQCY
ncbi:unnamed protein product, partial [Brenthis ino]